MPTPKLITYKENNFTPIVLNSSGLTLGMWAKNAFLLKHVRVRGKGMCYILSTIEALPARKKGRWKVSWQLVMSDGVTQVSYKASLSLGFSHLSNKSQNIYHIGLWGINGIVTCLAYSKCSTSIHSLSPFPSRSETCVQPHFFLNIYYAPGPVPGIRDMVVN